jgi:hypothetical protein
MEYVPGKTLDQLIGGKGLPIGEALKYAVQVADAPAAAHASRWIVPVVAVLAVLLAASALWYLLPTLVRETSPANATFAQLMNQPGEEYYPNLSPDGRSFVYASRASGNWDIYSQRVGGQNPVNVTRDCQEDDTQPAFSPDGDFIAFRSEREGGGIFVMGATGESAKRLTDFGYNPAWHPTARRLSLPHTDLKIPEG